MNAPTSLRDLARADLFFGLANAFAPNALSSKESLHGFLDLREPLALAGLSAGPWGELLGSLLERLETEDMDALRASHDLLFGATAVCPPWECSYVPRDRGAILGDVAAFHRAFGVGLDATWHERIDHISAEFELLAILHVMSARALEAEAAEDIEITQAAIQSLSRDHLDEWLPSFCARLVESDVSEWHAMLGALTLEYWLALHGDLELVARGRRLPLLDDGDDLACAALVTDGAQAALQASTGATER